MPRARGGTAWSQPSTGAENTIRASAGGGCDFSKPGPGAPDQHHARHARGVALRRHDRGRPAVGPADHRGVFESEGVEQREQLGRVRLDRERSVGARIGPAVADAVVGDRAHAALRERRARRAPVVRRRPAGRARARRRAPRPPPPRSRRRRPPARRAGPAAAAPAPARGRAGTRAAAARWPRTRGAAARGERDASRPGFYHGTPSGAGEELHQRSRAPAGAGEARDEIVRAGLRLGEAHPGGEALALQVQRRSGAPGRSRAAYASACPPPRRAGTRARPSPTPPGARRSRRAPASPPRTAHARARRPRTRRPARGGGRSRAPASRASRHGGSSSPHASCTGSCPSRSARRDGCGTASRPPGRGSATTWRLELPELRARRPRRSASSGSRTSVEVARLVRLEPGALVVRRQLAQEAECPRRDELSHRRRPPAPRSPSPARGAPSSSGPRGAAAPRARARRARGDPAAAPRSRGARA